MGVCVCVYTYLKLQHIYIYEIPIHTHTMEYYLAIKKNEVLPFRATWVGLEIMILSEVLEKEKYYIISYICEIYK